ncbi:MAG: hypothetical protein OXJ53_21120 [Gammaproteobacteria bacterium]|nr:hypothetical protein [Gammaproteobacteria bacterium]MDE0272094.1 hypothetical protein [Gammaproteobacteria bacterium]
MTVKTGSEYLASLRDDREVWMQGERIEDVTEAPGLARGAHTLASFIDKQHEEAHRDLLTYEEDGERHPISFLMPRSADDVRRRGTAFYEWARWSNGMFGRTPDYKLEFEGGTPLSKESRSGASIHLALDWESCARLAPN